MKTIRLLEADSPVVTSWKSRWEDPTEDKMEIVKDALSVERNVSRNVVDKIISFGEQFVENWIDSMKWDEIGYKDNEFIKFLEEYGNNSSEFLKNKENFIKIYDVYADGKLDTDLFYNGKEKDSLYKDIYNNLLTNSRTYTYELSDFRDIFKDFIELYDLKCPSNKMKTIFIDKNGDINQPATIRGFKNNWINKSKDNKNKLSNTQTTSNVSDKNKALNNIDKYIEDRELRNYMQKVLDDNS